jgi:hypothetical protein
VLTTLLGDSLVPARSKHRNTVTSRLMMHTPLKRQ